MKITLQGKLISVIVTIAFLFPLLPTIFASAADFRVGDTVKVSRAGGTNLRMGHSTSYLEINDEDYLEEAEVFEGVYGNGYAPYGVSGEVVEGPKNNSGYIWWRVKFTRKSADQNINSDGDNKYTGWMIENNMGFISRPSSTSLKPTIKSISPNPVPAIAGSQWITINGSNFVQGLNIFLRTGYETYTIPITSGYINSIQVKIYPNFTTTPAQWTVQAVNPDNQKSSELSFNVTAPVAPTPIQKPKPTVNISASSTSIPYNSRVKITWSSSNATSCFVSPDGWTGTSKSITEYLTSSKTYYLGCSGEGGTNSDSVTVTVGSKPLMPEPKPQPIPTPIPPLSPPSSLSTAVINNNNTAKLTWADNSNNENGFKVERKSGNSGSYSHIATRDRNYSYFNDSTISSGTRYCYRVRAFNSEERSGYSNESCVDIPEPIPPSTPVPDPTPDPIQERPTVNISASSKNISYNSKVIINWNSSNASSCKVTPTNWTGLSKSRSEILTVSKTYTINCKGKGGTVSDSVTVTVSPQNLPQVNPQVSVAPLSGEKKTKFSNTGEGFTPSGKVNLYFRSPDNKERIKRERADRQGGYTYNWRTYSSTLTGTYSYWAIDETTGKQSPTVYFTVLASPVSAPIPEPEADPILKPTANITVSADSIPYNSNVTITWNSSNATSCKVSPSYWRGTSDSKTETLKKSKTYTINCVGKGGSVFDSATVTVKPKAVEPIKPEIREGSLVQGSGQKVYKIENGKKRWVVNLTTFERNGYRWKNIITVSDTELNNIPEGEAIFSLKENDLLQREGDYRIFVYQNEHLRHIADKETFNLYGYKWENAQSTPAVIFNDLPKWSEISIQNFVETSKENIKKAKNLVSDSWVGRVVIDNPQNLQEWAARRGLDFIVIGDVFDLTHQSYLFVISDPDLDPSIAGLSALGILTTFAPQADPLVSTAKSIYKVANRIGKVSKPVRNIFISATNDLVKNFKLSDSASLKKDSESLKSILELSFKIEEKNAKVFEKVLKNQDDLLKLAGEGNKGFNFVERMIKQFDKVKFDWVPANLSYKGGLLHSWEGHIDHWQDLGIKNKDELDKIIKEVVRNPDKKVMYKYEKRAGVWEDQFGFYNKKTNIFITSDYNGNISTAFRAGKEESIGISGAGWIDYIKNKPMLFEF